MEFLTTQVIIEQARRNLPEEVWNYLFRRSGLGDYDATQPARFRSIGSTSAGPC